MSILVSLLLEEEEEDDEWEEDEDPECPPLPIDTPSTITSNRYTNSLVDHNNQSISEIESNE